jgi:Tfp pilus assembly protein PilX
MNSMHTTLAKQQGAILIIGLLFLLMLTIIGVSAMSTTAFEEKMAGNRIDREIAFQAAEAALRAGERHIETELDLDKVVFYSGGTDDADFTANNDGDTCTNGYCTPVEKTEGFLTNNVVPQSCDESAHLPQRWENCPDGTNASANNLQVWTTDGRHRTYSEQGGLSTGFFTEALKDPIYIIEFLGHKPAPGEATNCAITPGDPDSPCDTTAYPGCDAYPYCLSDPSLFRITAMGFGARTTTRVMLQSRYLKD